MYENLLAHVPTDLWIGGKWRKAAMTRASTSSTRRPTSSPSVATRRLRQLPNPSRTQDASSLARTHAPRPASPPTLRSQSL